MLLLTVGAHKLAPVIPITAFVLRHIESNNYVALRMKGRQYCLIALTKEEAEAKRDQLGLIEYVNIIQVRVENLPFEGVFYRGRTARIVRGIR